MHPSCIAVTLRSRPKKSICCLCSVYEVRWKGAGGAWGGGGRGGGWAEGSHRWGGKVCSEQPTLINLVSYDKCWETAYALCTECSKVVSIHPARNCRWHMMYTSTVTGRQCIQPLLELTHTMYILDRQQSQTDAAKYASVLAQEPQGCCSQQPSFTGNIFRGHLLPEAVFCEAVPFGADAL